MDQALSLEADRLGVAIAPDKHGELLPSDLAGYFPEIRKVLYQPWLGPTNRLCSVAHELGHAALGHVVDPPAWLHPRQEREADEWAARLLISEDEYVTAARHFDGHAGAIAQELGVTRRLVLAWRNHLERKIAS